MALLIVSGYPTSGKTHRAKQIVADFERRIGASTPSNASGGTVVRASDDDDPAQTLSAARPLTLSSLSIREAEQAGATKPDQDLSANSATSPPDALAPHADTPSQSNGNSRSTVQPLSTSHASQVIRPPRQRVRRIVYISDHTLQLPRTSYAHPHTAEKTARGNIYSAVKRALGRDIVLVLDGLNYIKGWRYQLHCEAKSVGVRSGVVHIGTSEEKSRELNQQRIDGISATTGTAGGSLDEDAYLPETHNELLMRYEEPNGQTRWDSPLFTVLWDDDPATLCDDIWRELVVGVGKDGKTKREVVPNQATVLAPASPSNFLHELDRTTQAICMRIAEYQREHVDDPGGTLTIDPPSAGLQLHLPGRLLTTPHLQRLRRQFLTLQRQHKGGMGAGAVGRVGNRDRERNESVNSTASSQSAATAATSSGSVPAGGARGLAGLFVDWLNDIFDRDM